MQCKRHRHSQGPRAWSTVLTNFPWYHVRCGNDTYACPGLYTRNTNTFASTRGVQHKRVPVFFTPSRIFPRIIKTSRFARAIPFGTTPIPQGWKGQKHRRLVQGAQQPHAHLSSLAVHISVLSPIVRSQQAVRRTRKTAARSATTAARVTSVSPMAARRLSLGYLWSLSTRDACRRC